MNSGIPVTGQTITFTNQHGELLTGNLYRPAGDSKVGVVFGHCFTCSRHTRILMESCESLYQNGIAALRFDFSGNGQSGGSFADTTYSKHIGEMKLAIAVLRENGAERIGLAGHSMGAAIALLTAASSTEVRAICTLAGRYSGLDVSGLLDTSGKNQLQQTGQFHFTSRGRSLVLTRNFFKDVANHDLPATVSKLKQPLLAIHGDRDEIIPLSEVYHSRSLKPESTEIVVIDHADHMFSQEQHRYQVAAKLTSWFKSALNP
jgi:putative redox protein